MTIKEYIQSGQQKSEYWAKANASDSTTSSSTTGTSSSSSTSFWKKVASVVTAAFSSASSTASATKTYFGEDPAYNDATKKLETGAFINRMPHLKRFHLGNEYGSASNNKIFFDGFEDPTHLTFKVEFGEFGASISNNDTIKETQKTSLASNVYYMDYDNFPMGLLDLNFASLDGTGSSATSDIQFNSQSTYNAVNYLINRNEDRRSQYLRDFIEGLYTLQRDFPYLFQKITGLSKIFETDPTRGQRLKDVTLQLSCLDDGLDQKLHTLFEQYRKACWDDIYQRWVLPDIMRYFKMIIYIFDNRSLQMGNGEFSPDQDFFPILALECAPCEFTVKSLFGNEYTQDYSAVKNDDISLEIKVKNVRTYMSNNLFQRVKYLKDVITQSDKQAKDDSSETNSYGQNVDWRFRWMQRMFLMYDEYQAFYDETGGKAAPRRNSNGVSIAHYQGDSGDWASFPINSNTILDYTPDNTWHRATVSDRAYVISNLSDLWKSLKSIITSSTILVRDSRQSDRYYFVNDMTRLDESTYEYYVNQNLIDIDINRMYESVQNKIENLVNKLKQISLDMNLDKPEQDMADLSLDSSKPEQSMTYITMNLDKPEYIQGIELTGGEIPEQKYVTLVEGVELPDQKFVEMVIDTSIPTQTMTEMTLNVDKPTSSFTELIQNLDKAKQEFTEMTLNLDKPGQDFTEIILNLDKLEKQLSDLVLNTNIPSQEFTEIELNLDKPDQQFAELLLNIDKAKQELTTMTLNLDKPEQEMTEIQKNLDQISQQFTELILNLEKPVREYVEMELNLDIPTQTMTEIEKNLDMPEQDYIEIEKNLDKPDQSMTEMIMNEDKADQEFVEMIINDSHAEMNMTEMIINDEHTEHDMADLEMNLSTTEQQFAELVDNDVSVSMSMVDVTGDDYTVSQSFAELIMNTDKTEQQMTESVFNTEVTHGQMVEPIMNTDKAEQQMTEMIMNTDVAHGQMADVDVTAEVTHGQMIEPIMNTDIAHGQMIEPIMNTDKAEQQMTLLDMNLDIQHGQMIEPVMNIDKLKQQMVEVDSPEKSIQQKPLDLQFNLSKPEQSLVPPVFDEHKQNESLIEPVFNTDIKHSQMTEPVMNVDKPTQSLMIPVFDEHKQSESLIEPVFDESHMNNDMVDLVMNNDHADMDMITPVFDERHTEENNMIEPQFNDDYSVELTPIELVGAEIPETMKMTELIINDDKKEDIKQVEIIETEPDIKMREQAIVETEPSVELKSQELIETEPNTDIKDVKLVETEPNAEIKSVGITGNESSSLNPDNMHGLTDETVPTMKLNPVNLVENESADNRHGMVNIEQPENGISSKTERKSKQLLSSGNIQTNNVLGEELTSKLQTLVSLDLNSLKDAPMEQLVKLVGILEDTVHDAKKKIKTAELVSNMRTNKMNMTNIPQPERQSYLGKKMQDVGEGSWAAAETAANRFKQRSEFTKNNR